MSLVRTFRLCPLPPALSQGRKDTADLAKGILSLLCANACTSSRLSSHAASTWKPPLATLVDMDPRASLAPGVNMKQGQTWWEAYPSLPLPRPLPHCDG